MYVRCSLLRAEGLELGVVGAQFSLTRGEVEALEKVRRRPAIGAVGETLSFGPAYDRGYLPFRFIAKKVVQTNSEDHGDAQQRRQGWIDVGALDFREQRRRKTAVLSELDQR